MPRQDEKVVSSQSGNWVLDLGAVRVHNDHLSIGKSQAQGCPTCSQGLEGVMANIAAVDEEPEVVEGDGGDEEDDPALPRSRGRDSR